MIKVQDWVASIPDEEKHIAYVGEGLSEQREFLLCGTAWERYKDHSFHLDMAFDPASITTHDNRQVVQTTVNSTEQKEEYGVIIDEVTTKETYTVDNVQTTNHYLTDIAPLSKRVEEDGIHLTWTVLRQHTVLPGKLWATIRAAGSESGQVKKSAIMVFEVEAAICAVPSAVPPISEFEQMESEMDALRQQTVQAAKTAETAANEALQSSASATIINEATLGSMRRALEAADEAHQYAEQASSAADLAAEHAQVAEQHHMLASSEANSAVDASARTKGYMESTLNYAQNSAISAEGARVFSNTAREAATQCSHYAQLCESYANSMASGTPDDDRLHYRHLNVRDYGAVGDGVTDDRAAILAAFEAAKTMLPCEVYFPAGTYGIGNGIYIKMALGSGGLRVCGAGRDVTTIRYLDSFAQLGNERYWYAIRIEPVTTPSTEDEYLHDICYTGLTVYDPNPCANAWHPDKGDSAKEETHGFDLQYCRRGSVTDCRFITVGDEAIDVVSCHDIVVANNHIIGSPAAGSGGGAISIGDGSVGVVVTANTVNGSAADELLANGTVIVKRNFGLNLESLFTPVRDVVVTNNVFRNIIGSGILLGTPNAGSGLYNISIANNICDGCGNGISDIGTNPKEMVNICGNIIQECPYFDDNTGGGIVLAAGGYRSLSVSGNTIKSVHGQNAMKIDVPNDATAIVTDNTIEDVAKTAMFVSGGTFIVRDCVIKNTGMEDASSAAAILQYGTTPLLVYGCRITGVRQTKAINGATEIQDTTIEMVDSNGDRVANEQVVASNYLTRLVNCQLDGYVDIRKDNALVQGVTLYCTQSWASAISVKANGVIITGCHIDNGATGRDAITEATGYNGNLFTNNVVNRPITTVGAQSVAVNNIRLTA